LRSFGLHSDQGRDAVPTTKSAGQVTCSFCKKSSDQVDKVIAGPDGVHICNECVGLCSEILDTELGGRR
jgi:hypothetical protein